MYDIIVTSLRHVSAWQCHLQRTHIKLNALYKWF